MTLRSLLSLFVLSGSLAVAACGSETSPAERGATPEHAIAEIGNVRSGLDQALATAKGGNAKQAEEQLSELYVEHFEHVEGPLEQADRELKEQLETTLATTLRDAVRRGAPVAELQSLVDGAQADLDTADAKLR